MAMSQKIYEREIVPTVRRLREASDAGLFDYQSCYSPRDTLDDTRYVVNVDGETRTLRHREINYFLDAHGV